MGNNKSKETVQAAAPIPAVVPPQPPQELVASKPTIDRQNEENPTLGKRQNFFEDEIPVSRKEHTTTQRQVRELEDLLRKMARRLEVLEEKERVHANREKETAVLLTKVALKGDLINAQLRVAESVHPVVGSGPLSNPRELRQIDANSTKQQMTFEIPPSRTAPGGMSVPNKTGPTPSSDLMNPHDLINQIKDQLRRTKPAPEALEETRSLYKRMKQGFQAPSGEPPGFKNPFMQDIGFGAFDSKSPASVKPEPKPSQDHNS